MDETFWIFKRLLLRKVKKLLYSDVQHIQDTILTIISQESFQRTKQEKRR